MSALPYWPPLTTTLELPLLGPTTIGVFGPVVLLGIALGWRASLHYARERGLSTALVADAAWWSLVGGFGGAHLVAVLAYHPERVLEAPWILLAFWSGIASTGGFLGAVLGVLAWCRRRRQPLLPYADALLFGLLVGFTFGRIGCSLVHDHPGLATDASSWLAIGPWPCACAAGGADPSCCTTPIYRWDLGVLELLLCLALLGWSRGIFDWRRAAPGRLLGWVALAYGLVRFPLDALRIADREHFGLTFAQWASLAFVAIGLRLLWTTRSRRPEVPPSGAAGVATVVASGPAQLDPPRDRAQLSDGTALADARER